MQISSNSLREVSALQLLGEISLTVVERVFRKVANVVAGLNFKEKCREMAENLYNLPEFG